MCLPVGVFAGEWTFPTFEKLLHSAPFGLSGKRLCPCASTALGCHDPECTLDHASAEAHSTAVWPVAWHLCFALQGYHHSLQGKLSTDKIFSFLSEDQAAVISQLTPEMQDQVLRYRLARQLYFVANPTAAPKSAKPIQDSLTNLTETELWGSGNGCPWELGSKSGMPIKSVSRFITGMPDALFSGTNDDMGEAIQLSPGDILQRMCAVKVMAAGLQPRASSSPLAFMAASTDLQGTTQ